MKKLPDIVVMLCALGAAVLLWLSSGPQFLKLVQGPVPLGEGELARAEGEYVFYEAAYPVASFVEEYYSGDPDRVRRTGYVVYDEQRKAFVYIIVSDKDERDYKDLMWNLHLAAELRENKDMAPVPVRGSLEPMDEKEIGHIFAALENSEIVGLYDSVGGGQEDQAYFEVYFGDAYGKVTAAMCRELEQGWEQAEWYRIDHGKINGLANYEIWISVIAAALNLLVFIGLLLGLPGDRGRKSRKEKEMPVSADKVEILLEAQRSWVGEWCVYSLNRTRRMAYLSAVGGPAVLAVIGAVAKVSLQGILALHVPLGLLLGEGIAMLFWFAQKGQAKPDKILGKFRKNIKREMPSLEERASFADDLLDAGREWTFREKVKDSMLQGIVGSRYFAVFFWNGAVTVVDSGQLAKVETETISGQVRSGRVRIRYHSYIARFYYKSTVPKRICDKTLTFQTWDARADLMILARKRLGDSVEIAEG